MAATCSNVRPSGRGLSTTAATAARHLDLDLGEANQEALAQEISPDQSKIWTSTTVTSSGLGVDRTTAF